MHPVPIKRAEPTERYPFWKLEEVLRRAGDEKASGNITINLSGGKAVGLDVRITACRSTDRKPE
jgi:hypothetical protein